MNFVYFYSGSKAYDCDCFHIFLGLPWIQISLGNTNFHSPNSLCLLYDIYSSNNPCRIADLPSDAAQIMNRFVCWEIERPGWTKINKRCEANPPCVSGLLKKLKCLGRAASNFRIFFQFFCIFHLLLKGVE